MEDEEFLDLLHLVDRFNEMQQSNEVYYFDVDQFEALSDYFYDAGKLKQALQVMEVAAEQHPYHSHFALRKVQYLTAANRVKEASAEIDQLEEQLPNSFDLYMARGALQSKLGHHRKAIQHYRQALQVADFPDDVYGLLALEYQVTGQYERAVRYLKLTLECNPEDEIGLYNLALCYDLMEKNEEGIAYFSKFVDQNPYAEVAWYHLGIMYAKVKEIERAIWALDYAILIDDFFSAAYFEKATLLEQTYRYQEAIHTYQSTFEAEGATGFAFYKMGLCYLHLNQRQKALSHFTKAIQEDDELDEAYFELALMKDEDEDWTEAVYFIDKALELDNDNLEYLCTSAEIHRRAGQIDEAELHYAMLLENGLTKPMIYIDYAELLFEMCDFEDGMEVLYEGVQNNPQSAEIHYRLAGYLYSIEESDEADIYFRKALELDADRRMHFFELFPQLKQDHSVRAVLSQHRF